MTGLPHRLWQDMTTTDFDALDAERMIAVLPVAAVEQHGPHLPLAVDACINEGLIAETLKRLPADLSVAVLPAQPVGYSEEHLRFPGTLSLSAETLARLWTEISDCVARAGVRKLVLFNSHGGQTQVMNTVIRTLRVRHGMLAVAVSWYRLAETEGLFEEAEIRHGIHGGALETSVMLHLRPDLVRMDQIRNFTPTSLAMAREFKYLSPHGPAAFGWETQDLHPSGAVGDATQANADRGRRIVEQVADSFAALLQEVDRFDVDRLAGKGED